MSAWLIILIFVVVVAAVFGIIYLLFPFLIKRGVDLFGIISTAKKVLDTSDTVVDAVGELMPNVGAFD